MFKSCLKCNVNKMHNNTTQVDHKLFFTFVKLLKGWNRKVEMLVPWLAVAYKCIHCPYTQVFLWCLIFCAVETHFNNHAHSAVDHLHRIVKDNYLSIFDWKTQVRRSQNCSSKLNAISVRQSISLTCYYAEKMVSESSIAFRWRKQHLASKKAMAKIPGKKKVPKMRMWARRSLVA